MRFSGHDHRKAILLVVDHAVDHDRPRRIDHATKALPELLRRIAPDTGTTIRLSKRDVIGLTFVDTFEEPAPMSKPLPLSYHAIVRVVQNQHLDWEPILNRDGKLLKRHFERAVAVDIDDECIRMRQLYTDG